MILIIKRFSVIYIGSNKCELIIGQRGKGRINILDRAMYPINFGVQTFTKGRISFKSVYPLCQIINEYISMSKTYDVEAIKIVGTAALREAENRLYILEQIKINTGGYTVEILERDEEIHLIYRHMLLKCENKIDLSPNESGNQMLAAISSGNISVALIKKGLIDYYQTAEAGYLKMKEILKDIEDHSERFETLILEFIVINTDDIVKNIRERKIKKLVISSHEVDVIAKLCGYEKRQTTYEISSSVFENFCKTATDLTPNQLMKKFPPLSQNEASTFKHTLLLYLKLILEAKVDSFVLTPMSIGDAILDLEFQVIKNQKLMEWLDESTTTSAKAIAKKYRGSLIHETFVEGLSLKIFDALKKRFLLEKEERRILSLACYLMKIGSFINHENFWSISASIIEKTEIIGITKKERLLIAKVIASLKSKFNEKSFSAFPGEEKEQMVIAKLSAILKLSIALDKSEQQKIQKIQCHLKEDLIIEVFTEKNVQLEEYFFNAGSRTMENVYGIKAILKIKRIEL